MFRAILVDDEIMVRAAVEKMIDWEAEGFTLECFQNGEAAMEAFASGTVDLVLTDMRMPVCDGLELIGRIRAEGHAPVILVLSAFDDFPLVKEAFKRGAADYLLKVELSAPTLLKPVRAARSELELQGRAGGGRPGGEDRDLLQFQEVLCRHADPSTLFLPEGGYAVACYFLDNLHKEMDRFGSDIAGSLTGPLTKLVRQIPQLRPRDAFASYDTARYFLLYRLTGGVRTRETCLSVISIVKKAWKNYMNLSTTVGVAFAGPGDDFYRVMDEAELYTTLRYILGPGGVYTAADRAAFDPMAAREECGRFAPLIGAVLAADFEGVRQEEAALFGRVTAMRPEEARREVLLCLFNLCYEIGSQDLSIGSKLGLDTDLSARIGAIPTVRELQIYFTALLRRVMEYFEYSLDRKIPDQISKAKRYIDSHYMRASLSLREVAEEAGYHEKYFCTLFKRAYGVSFSDYLTAARMGAARDLLGRTDLKIYQVADAVGYNNVEHFVRTFKKAEGTSPNAFRRKDLTIDQ